MTGKKFHIPIAGRRAELMAELFLQDLNPRFLSRPTARDVGFDLLLGIANRLGGTNVFAVQVKYTEQPPEGCFSVAKSDFERLVSSNIPSLMLVADVKHNQLYYGLLNSGDFESGRSRVSISVVELDETGRTKLLAQLKATAVK